MLHAAGDADAAVAELERALELLDASGSLNHTARAHQTLAALHKGAGRFETALRHQEAFHAAERAQFNQESDNRLRAFQVQFDLAEARHEAEMQRIRRLELASAHDELNALHQALQESDREKSRLLVRLSEQSRTDSLTGLANRRHLDERLAEEFSRAARHGHALSVALCDIDFFKRVNDRFGHGTGDEVLRRVATLLRERCRTTDLVARYGGEEFCIVFLETDGAQAARICEEVRAVIEVQDWGRIHPDLAVTLSIGLCDDVALGQPDRVIAAADTYLYEAKHAGKNRVRWRGATAKKETPSLPVA
jgi:diguanylate cyclase (GGDEF)-like protein